MSQELIYKWSQNTQENALHHYSTGKCKSKSQSQLFHCIARMAISKKTKITKAGKYVQKGELPCTADGNVN
jgi:23S rRNA maturation mini-RNase III